MANFGRLYRQITRFLVISHFLLNPKLLVAQEVWRSDVKVVDNNDFVVYYQFAESYDGGIWMLFSTQKNLVLQKINSNGQSLLRKIISVHGKYSGYYPRAHSMKEEPDHGILITGTIWNIFDSREGAYRLKLSPCLEGEYLIFSDTNCYQSYIGKVNESSSVQINLNFTWLGTTWDTPLKIDKFDNASHKFVNSIRLFERNNPDIRGIKSYSDGFFISGSAYFEYKPVPELRLLHAFFLDIDTALNVKKKIVFDDSLRFFTISYSAEKDIENYFVYNFYKDTLNKQRYNIEIVKIPFNNSSIERHRFEKKIETSGGGPIYKIGNGLVGISSYYSDTTRKKDIGMMFRFDLGTKTFSSMDIDSTSSLFAVDLIKTQDSKLIFIFRNALPQFLDPIFSLYKYKSNLEPDTIYGLDTGNYNYACPTGVNTDIVELMIDSFFSSVSDVNYREAIQISLYPNPVGNELTVELSAMPVKNSTLTILDNQGRLVIQEKLFSQSATIETSHLATGIYILQINGENCQLLKKFVIVR